MATFPYILNIRAIDKFFGEFIGSAGVPDRVNTRFLPSIGLKSKNDRPIVSVLVALGFLGADGVPTELWRQYRSGRERGAVLAAAIKRAYSDLYQTYPNAHDKDDGTITDFMRAGTDVSAGTVSYMVRTFRKLCEYAEFGPASPEAVLVPPPEPPETKTQPPSDPPGAGIQPSATPTIAINIMLQIPPTDDPAVYERLFAAMKKHFG